MTRAPWYATREAAKAALDIAETSRTNTQIDRELAAATRDIDAMCRRVLWPLTTTRTFDYPDAETPTSWRLWLDQGVGEYRDLISVTSMSSGGTTITAADYFLRPDDGPPYTNVELDLSSSAAFGGGATRQRDITIAGLWGWHNDTEPAGQLAEALDTSETAVDVTDSATVGVGDLLAVDSERLVVTGKRMLDTGQTAGGAGLTASMAAQSLTVQSGASFTEGETLLIDAEKLRVDEVAGNTLVVKRAHDGSTLAAHTAGATIYAPRTLTVVRAAAGTTAATHNSGTAVTRWIPPELASSLTLAIALTSLLNQRTGFAGGRRRPSSGEGSGDSTPDYGSAIGELRKQVMAAYGRRARHRAI